MGIEAPRELLRRLKLGREEYCQRLLTMLIVDGAYPRWDARTQASPDGAEFLTGLYRLAYGRDPDEAPAVFVDEFDLPPRHDAEQRGAPDWAVMWPDRLWMIELKTEAGSHRRGQLDHYLDLARHHYPTVRIDLTYLTPPLSAPGPTVRSGEQWSHLTWDSVLPLVQQTWATGNTRQQACVAMLDDVLNDLNTSWSTWRSTRLAQSVVQEAGPREDPISEGVALAERTAIDGDQRALDFLAGGLEELDELRLQLRDMLCTRRDDDSVRRVRPWVWSSATSGGGPLTEAGAEAGYEVRLSRYARPVC